MIGARERLCDVEDGTPNMNSSIGDNGDIVIIPHMYGFPIRLKLRPGVHYIEDACQSLGAKIDGTPVGLQGDVSIF